MSHGMSDTTARREPRIADDVGAVLIDLYRRRGKHHYDEVVSQTDHARQCGALARAAKADASTIVAAFLHDVGHLLADVHDRDRDLRHEVVGARFLANWFGPEVTEPIRLHVSAKRYLCATSPDYLAALSPASIASLALQGGPMSEHEVAAFDAEPGADAAVALRRWDDLAKQHGAPTPTLDWFRSVLIDQIG